MGLQYEDSVNFRSNEMPSTLLVTLCFALTVSFTVVKSSTTSVVCVAGQCVQGVANITLGETLSAQGTSAQLLPGQYTAQTGPQLLNILLTSPAASLSPSPGFNSTSVFPLPLSIVLQPGIVFYPDPSYAGPAQFVRLPSAATLNSSVSSPVPLQANSLAVSKNVWAAVTSGSATNRIILWDAIADFSQLPPGASESLTLIDMQSSACSPPCSGSGFCSASATCTCPTGFTGPSCETCAQGFAGPTCQPCPVGCKTCDEGISGSGLCLAPTIGNTPATCNCLNGQCTGSNGQCACNPGWTTSTNGTACAQCLPGFFLDSSGDCSVCELGCSECEDGTGTCTTCKEGFTHDANDPTKCDHPQDVAPGQIICPLGSFSSGQGQTPCSICSPSCRTCTQSAQNCIECGPGLSSFNGKCVTMDPNGICEGSNGMIANNVKTKCDTCGAKCTSCKIPNFNVASTINNRQCTGCLPGFFLSNGSCIENCPLGTFVSPQDNLTCTACSPSCGTCLGSANFCLTCTSQQLASSGQCVSICPSGTFAAAGACLKCHPDCASCSGPSFSQCSTCPPKLPVLVSGRCLPTCSKSQFFDTTTSSCQACDPSCSSCYSSGPNGCLACSGSTQVLRGGSCESVNCSGIPGVVPGLGVCLSNLVELPASTNTTSSATSSVASSTSSAAPSATTTGSANFTVNSHSSLMWWQILLMAFGSVLIFIVILMFWRRRSRKQRINETVMFASTKRLDGKKTWGWGWRWKLLKVAVGRKSGEHIAALPMSQHNLDNPSESPQRQMQHGNGSTQYRRSHQSQNSDAGQRLGHRSHDSGSYPYLDNASASPEFNLKPERNIGHNYPAPPHLKPLSVRNIGHDYLASPVRSPEVRRNYDTSRGKGNRYRDTTSDYGGETVLNFK